MTQTKRIKNMEAFTKGVRTVLLATDLASRGLDIRVVELVINYDFPADYKDYVHRAGRAARGGARGRCISLITQYDVEKLQETEQKIGHKMQIYEEFKDKDILQHMNKLDKLKRKLKIGMLLKGTEEKFAQIKEKKLQFQQAIKDEKKN